MKKTLLIILISVMFLMGASNLDKQVFTVSQILPSCVMLDNGSGVVVGDTKILTANHVVVNNAVTIRFYNNKATIGKVLSVTK
jgi:hypothetical protein